MSWISIHDGKPLPYYSWNVLPVRQTILVEQALYRQITDSKGATIFYGEWEVCGEAKIIWVVKREGQDFGGRIQKGGKFFGRGKKRAAKKLKKGRGGKKLKGAWNNDGNSERSKEHGTLPLSEAHRRQTPPPHKSGHSSLIGL